MGRRRGAHGIIDDAIQTCGTMAKQTMTSIWLRRASLVSAITTAVLAARAAWLLATAPIYGSATTAIALNQPAGPTFETATTLAEENGPGVYIILALPVLFALLPLLARWTELRAEAEAVSPLLLAMFVVAAAWTIGLDFELTAVFAGITAILGLVERRLATAGA